MYSVKLRGRVCKTAMYTRATALIGVCAYKRFTVHVPRPRARVRRGVFSCLAVFVSLHQQTWSEVCGISVTGLRLLLLTFNFNLITFVSGWLNAY